MLHQTYFLQRQSFKSFYAKSLFMQSRCHCFPQENFSHSFRAVILENVNSCFLALAFCLFKSIQRLLLSLKLSLFYFTFNGLFIFLIFFGFPISVPSVLPFSFDFSLYQHKYIRMFFECFNRRVPVRNSCNLSKQASASFQILLLANSVLLSGLFCRMKISCSRTLII